jgi:hypothetical protein
MSPKKRTINQRVDDALTTYLRNTTTDQEIKDFYGEGNIVGRKGIPADDKGLLDAVQQARRADPNVRPTLTREKFDVGGIDQSRGYDYSTRDIPGAVDPGTGRSWQMTFGELPKDFGDASLTPAALQYLRDFRIPRNAGSDFSFDTGPNIADRIETDIRQAQADYDFDSKGRFPARAQERFDAAVEKARSQSPDIRGFGGQPQTPQTWIERGYATSKPEDFKTKTLDAFRNRVLESQGQFGGVSTLTPVEQPGATNPDWRADLYEKVGLAGPQSSQPFASGYGGGEKTVQRFTTGKTSLLPLQPYTEFLERVSGETKPSVLNTTPAPDFTPFQKAVGPRNYLIARNILQGRGSLGRGVRGATSVGAVDLIPSRGAVRDFYRGDVKGGVSRMAGDFVQGVPLAAGAGFAASVLPAAVSTVALPAVAGSAALMAGGEALDEATMQQTGEGLLDKFRQTVNKVAGPGFGRPTTGSAYRGSERADEKRARIEREGRQALEDLARLNRGEITFDDLPAPPVAQLRPISREEAEASMPPRGENEFQRRTRLAAERFNPSRGEFGLTELLFGK